MNRGVALAVCLLAVACRDGGGEGAQAPAAGDTPEAAANAPEGRAYERDVVFVTPAPDSLIMVPWVIESSSRPGRVDRISRGWLVRSGAWEPFLRVQWSTPPTRAPWRILPREGLRIVVGEGDRLDRIFYEAGSRSLEIVLGEPVTQWTGSQGGAFQLNDGALLLGDRRLEGRVLDISQAVSPREGALGDWIFLMADESLAVVIQAPRAAPEPDEVRYEGWARLEDEDLRWPDVEVAWTRTQGYERARRDVPAALTLGSPTGDFTAELTVRAVNLEARSGSGPVLPVDGFLELEGTVVLRGRTRPVRGLLRHRQP